MADALVEVGSQPPELVDGNLAPLEAGERLAHALALFRAPAFQPPLKTLFHPPLESPLNALFQAPLDTPLNALFQAPLDAPLNALFQPLPASFVFELFDPFRYQQNRVSHSFRSSLFSMASGIAPPVAFAGRRMGTSGGRVSLGRKSAAGARRW